MPNSGYILICDRQPGRGGPGGDGGRGGNGGSAGRPADGGEVVLIGTRAFHEGAKRIAILNMGGHGGHGGAAGAAGMPGRGGPGGRGHWACNKNAPGPDGAPGANLGPGQPGHGYEAETGADGAIGLIWVDTIGTI